jgi:cell filamentation protein
VSSDDDPYCYPGLNVLRNKAGIRDARELQEFEHRKSALRELQLRDRPIAGNFDLDHLKAIHKHLFQDVYEWAGEERTVMISKGGSLFALPEYIGAFAAETFDAIAKDNYLKTLDKDRFTARLAEHYANINSLHPFREANGRTTRTFLRQLAQQADYHLDYSKVDKQSWNTAAKQSFDGDNAPMREVFQKVATSMRAMVFHHAQPADALERYPDLKPAFEILQAATIYAERIASVTARGEFVAQSRARIARALYAGRVPDLNVKTNSPPRER